MGRPATKAAFSLTPRLRHGVAIGYDFAMNENQSTHHKALALNLDPSKYGVIAEIGAGQEVARWFFRVGAAAGTVAKTTTMSSMT